MAITQRELARFVFAEPRVIFVTGRVSPFTRHDDVVLSVSGVCERCTQQSCARFDDRPGQRENKISQDTSIRFINEDGHTHPNPSYLVPV